MQRSGTAGKLDVVVVIPVYNEVQCIAQVLHEWERTLDAEKIRFRIDVYNDGSSDGTTEVLEESCASPNFRVIHKANSGHGPTILQGYREAAQVADWILQVDSDGEISCDEFPAFWRMRPGHDFVLGYRQNRVSPMDRRLITFGSRWAVRCLFGSGIRDANCPFRLMRGNAFAELFALLPADCFAPNVILSGLAIRRKLSIVQSPIAFRTRTTGKVSIVGRRLWKSALRSMVETARASRIPIEQAPLAVPSQPAQAEGGKSLHTGRPKGNGVRSVRFDFGIVGSGLFGSVMAERLSAAGYRVIVLEKRDHVGGNCATYLDPVTNTPIHQYGTHIFHTNDERVWGYVNRFAEFNDYQHRVVTKLGGRSFPMPINLDTINRFFNTQLKPGEVEGFLSSKRIDCKQPKNLEEKALSLVGPELYEAFIRGYTWKQWNRDPRELPASIINRLPVRTNRDARYFSDRFQGVPTQGYTPLFEGLLRNIPTELETDFIAQRDFWQRRCARLIYTGPIDAYFNHCYGRLNWRSVRFEKEYYAGSDFQGSSVVNYADREVPYTRIHEPQHLHPERVNSSGQSVIMREYSQVDDEAPYYPVGASEDQTMLARYEQLRKKESGVIFGGRLATYRYFDMHQVVGAALRQAELILQESGQRKAA